MCRFSLIFCLLLAAAWTAVAAEQGKTRTVNMAPVAQWIARQSELRTLSADFVQTRTLKTLKDPLQSPGRLWFQAPDAFRWELDGKPGEPLKAILLRKKDDVLLISPRQKKATRYSAKSIAGKAGAPGMAMMEFPMAKDLNDFLDQFDVQDLQMTGQRCDLAVLPKDVATRKYLKSLLISFDTATGYLLAFEMTTKEGSTLRNEFSNVRVNGPVDKKVFDFDFTGYQVVDGKG
ncbi:MAG TPA: outer membrane lipoprotein carrier protein LolA [Chthoniobacterales bacterium]